MRVDDVTINRGSESGGLGLILSIRYFLPFARQQKNMVIYSLIYRKKLLPIRIFQKKYFPTIPPSVSRMDFQSILQSLPYNFHVFALTPYGNFCFSLKFWIPPVTPLNVYYINGTFHWYLKQVRYGLFLERYGLFQESHIINIVTSKCQCMIKEQPSDDVIW